MADEDDLHCRQAARLLSAANDRALSERERQALERHLAECLACTNYEIQVKFIKKAAARFQSGGGE